MFFGGHSVYSIYKSEQRIVQGGLSLRSYTLL